MESVDDTVFCLSYELRMLSGLLLERKTERWLEHCCLPSVHKEHIQRYQLATNHTKGKRVLDLACGVGHGSKLMASVGEASSVDGCDIEDSAIRYAQIRSSDPRCTFRVADGLEFNEPGTYDLIVCFETIEHVPNPIKLLQNLTNSLRAGGLLLLSTPISRQNVDLQPDNPYHVQEWGFSAFQELVSNVVPVTTVYVQYYLMDKPPGLGSRLLRRLQRTFGIAQKTSTKATEDVVLEEWKTSGLRVSDCGTLWRGFQILVCERRPAGL